MSKQGSPLTANIKLKLDRPFLYNLFNALSYNAAKDKRVETNIKVKSDVLDITIKANDFNILLAVNNSIMQSIKMLEVINKYE
jgi:tRNA threonylcarbamoyladenosine modification (KEOPS) complex  Pcc1 subunit